MSAEPHAADNERVIARFNAFEGSRRIALLLKIAWIVGTVMVTRASAQHTDDRLWETKIGVSFVPDNPELWRSEFNGCTCMHLCNACFGDCAYRRFPFSSGL